MQMLRLMMMGLNATIRNLIASLSQILLVSRLASLGNLKKEPNKT